MSFYGANFRIGSAKYLNATSIRCSVVSVFSILLLTGCSTVTTYKPNKVAGPAKPAGYPIPVYTEDMTVPRPCRNL